LLVLWIFCLFKVLQLILDCALLDHCTTLFNLDLCKVESFHYINNLLFVLLFISIMGENKLIYLCLFLVLPITINVVTNVMDILDFVNMFNRLTMKESRPSYWSIFSTPSSCRFTKIPFACYPITRCSDGQCLPTSFFMNECNFNFAKSWCSYCVLAFKIGAT
jgi:hypothetical protein